VDFSRLSDTICVLEHSLSAMSMQARTVGETVELSNGQQCEIVSQENGKVWLETIDGDGVNEYILPVELFSAIRA